MKSVYLAIACAITIHVGTWAIDYAPPEKPAALALLKTIVTEAVASGKKVELWLTVFGSNQKTELSGADTTSFSVKVQGNILKQTWEKVTPEQLAAVGKGCLQDDGRRALALADFCFAHGLSSKADEALTLAAQYPNGTGEELSRRMKFLSAGARVSKSDGASTSSPDNSASAGASESVASKRQSSDAARWDAGVFTGGKLNMTAYEREGRDCSAQAIHRRLGPDYDFYNKGSKGQTFTEVYMPPSKTLNVGRNGKGFSYQVGGPYDSAANNTFGATAAQVFYVPDKAGDPGIDRIETYSWFGNCMITKPEHVWWGGAHPEPAVLRKEWISAAGGALGSPYAMGRSHLLWCNDALILFNTGFVGATGNQTSDDKFAHFLFPRHKIPTSVAVTNRNEFALVTVWDTQTGKGQVAVLALEALGLAFHSWVYIGMPNAGSYSRIKLLGYVDLPGMATPTGICAGGNNHGGHLDGGSMLSTAKLDDQATRDSFFKGKNKEQIASAGYAAVISKHESKVAFLDLQPLFEYFRQMYLTTPDNFAKTKDSGIDPKQWPFSFDIEPRSKPIVVSVISQPTPTAILGALRWHNNPPNVYVASQDGRIGIYRINGLATDAPVMANDIKCVGTVQAGRNPTQMQFLRTNDPLISDSSPYEMNRTFAVCCRGDREIDFIHFDGTKAEVYRRIRDSRLLDPVAMDFSECTLLVAVADFKGRKVINYRIGPITDHHFTPSKKVGPGPDGKSDFECGGYMEFPGFVYDVNGSNVN